MIDATQNAAFHNTTAHSKQEAADIAEAARAIAPSMPTHDEQRNDPEQLPVTGGTRDLPKRYWR